MSSVLPLLASFFSPFCGQAEPPPPCCPEPTLCFYQSCVPFGVDLSLGLDDFRGIYSGSWQNHFGAVAAVNMKFPLPRSFFVQLAGSYGLYDWSGRASTPFKNSKTYMQQGFLTTAFSYQTPCKSGWNGGAAYDWMFAKNFGIFAVDPDLNQVRGQFGYLFRGRNELGLWGTYGVRKDHEESRNIPLEFRAISQVNLFWCHYFKGCAYGMLWVGTPYRRGLHYKSGHAGNYIVGAQFSAPLTHNLSIDGHASYMGARHRAGVDPSKNYGANIYFALTYSFGKRTVSITPYMTLANNTNFMVDTNQNF